MAPIKVTGVVLRTVNYRDYDRILTLFTRERGSITVSARGVRRTNARWRAGCELFAEGEYLLYARGTRYYLSQADVRQSSYDLRNNPEAMMHAAFIANMMEAVIVSDEPNEPLYALLMRALALYCHADTDIARVTDYVLVHAMRILGFGLQLGECVRCHSKIDHTHFSIPSGGVVCTGCNGLCAESRPIHPALLDAMRALSHAHAEDIPALPMHPKIPANLLPLLVSYTQYHLDRVFKSASLLYTFFS
ncbi:MAG: DNA repair protein RecO [Bacillota bacterium]